jgi:hypothetical protein
MNLKFRSSTVCILFLFLSISGLVVLATPQTAEGAGAWTVHVYAKTTAGVQLSGVSVTIMWQLTSPVRWVSFTYKTPITILGPEGNWKFTAPMSVMVGGAKYSFARWEASGGYSVSASNSFTYWITSSRSFYAVYAQAQTTTTTTRTTRTTQGYFTTTAPPSNRYTVYLIVKAGATGISVAHLSVYLDNNYVGQTDSYGRLTITNVSAGSHRFVLKYSGGLSWYATYYVNNNVQLTLTLQF